MPLLGIYPREMKTYIHTKTCMWMFIVGLFVIAPKLEIALMPFHWWMDKQTVVHPYNGILHSNKKECAPDSWDYREDPQMLSAESRKPETKGCALCDSVSLF